jgi:hypothetical protein
MPNRLHFKSIEEYYTATAKYVAVTTVVVFPGFAINNFVLGRDAIGYLSLAVICILVTNAVFNLQNRLQSPAYLFIRVLNSGGLSDYHEQNYNGGIIFGQVDLRNKSRDARVFKAFNIGEGIR